MPALRDTIAATERRDPLTVIRTQLAMAEADLNGLVARLAGGHLDADATRQIRKAVSRVYGFRHSLDEARLNLLPFEALNGRRLCTNDEDDMSDALLHAAARLRLGVDDTAAFRTPLHAADIRRGEVPYTEAAE